MKPTPGPVTREEFDALTERVNLLSHTTEDSVQRIVGLSHDVNAIQSVIKEADTSDDRPHRKKS